MASQRAMYEIEIRHDGLNKYRHIRGSDQYVVQQKAEVQKRAWDEQWRKLQEKEATQQQKIAEKIKSIQSKEAKRQLAEERNAAAKDAVAALRDTLIHTLSVNDAIDWDSLKSREVFSKKPPVKKIPPPPALEVIPAEPQPEWTEYRPKLGVLGHLFSSIRRKRTDAALEIFKRDHDLWSKTKEEIELRNTDDQRKYDDALRQTEAQFLQEMKVFQEEKDRFEAEQKDRNRAVDEKKAQYLQGEPGAIIDYCDMVLADSDYPDFFPKDWDLDYLPESKLLIVEYHLPDRTALPTLKEVSYVASKNDLKEVHLSSRELDQLYDDLLYQVALRTLHELFEADVVDALTAVVFNGWVTSLDKATGNQVTACILSIQANKEEFSKINLANIEPKLCFKNLKGVGSSKLHSLTPIPPIVQINRDDRRFVTAYAVADQLSESVNLATMGWEDFEHLVRELFEKEFRQNSGEVKVTRASRDGGVDAVAFDPDPIRGGKIVIQAKRYTQTVGISAVRDLYGTVMNEGATKGILVTTADYGPDAYDFAKGKPLTLLNGANLLHLLEKHGHQARIDIKEARWEARK